jgi:hypothetical protein
MNVDRNELQCYTSTTLKLHEFIGTSILCNQCHKTKTNPVHLDNKKLCAVCNVETPIYICSTCLKPLCEQCKNKHLRGNDPENDYKPIPKSESTTNLYSTKSQCTGHLCAICDKEWFHDYNCGRPKDKRGLCKECTTNQNTDIHRPDDLKDLKHYLGEPILSGSEKVQAIIDGEIDLYTAMHFPDGRRKDNYQEIARSFIDRAERAISTLRANIQGYSKARRTQEELDLKEVCDKLSQEEIEEYKKNQIKSRSGVKPKKSESTNSNSKHSIPISDTDKQRSYKVMLLEIKKNILSKHPNLSQEELKSKIARRAEIVDIPFKEEDVI